MALSAFLISLPTVQQAHAPPVLTIPSGVVYYVPITLTNSQSSPVAGGTQIMLTVDWNTYSTYLNAQASNVVFFDFSGNLLNSWMQSFVSTSDAADTVWVQLNSTGIPATSHRTIYMGFYSISTNNFNPSGNWGEAPTLSGTYGQYDNGANVFTVYDNFAGTSLSSKWELQASSGGAVTVNNGITFSAATGSDYVYIHPPTTMAFPLVFESDMLSATASAYGAPNVMVGASLGTALGNNVQNGTPCSQPYNGYDYDFWENYVEIDLNSATQCVSTLYTGGITFTPGVWSLTWYATGAEVGTDSVHSFSWNDASFTIGNYYLYTGILANNQGSYSAQWVRARVTPPNDAMPSASFGNITQAPTVTQSITITVANSAPSATFSISGCGVSNSTLSADGYKHTYSSITPSCSITVTVSSDGTYTRYRFSGPSTTSSFTSCFTGTCSTESLTVYYQVQNAFEAAPMSPTTWNGVFPITISGTSLGTSGSTICSMSTSNGGGAVSCSGYSDYDTQVSFPASLDGGVWSATGSYDFVFTTGGGNYFVDYAVLTAVLSSSLSLVPSVNQPLGVITTPSIALAPALAVQGALSSVVSAAMSLSSSVNQAVAGVTTAASMVIFASVAIQGTLSSMVSASVSLVSSMGQALSVTTGSSIGLTPTLAIQAALSSAVSAAMSLAATVNQDIGSTTVAASILLSASLTVQGAFSGLLSTALSLVPSVNQALGVTTSSSMALASTLAIQAALSTIVAAALSLTPTINQSVSGITQAGGVVISASLAVQGALSTLVSASVSLVSSIGQDLTVTTSSTIGLSITLAAQAALSAALSGGLSLLSTLNSGVGVVSSATTSLTLSLDQDLAAIANSASLLVSPALNQDIGGIDQAASIVLSASLGAAAALSALLSPSVSLVAVINQTLGVTTPVTVLLASSINQALAAISDSASMALAAGVDQSISGIASTVNIALSASLSVQAAFSLLLSAVVSLAPSIGQDLGVNSSSSVTLLSSLSQDLSGITSSVPVALSSNLGLGIGGIMAGASVLLSPFLQVGSSLSAVLSSSESLVSGLDQTLSNTLSPTFSLVASFSQNLGIVVSAAMSLGASLNQDLGGIIMIVSESLSPVLQAGGSFFTVLSAAVSLSPSVNQALGSIVASGSLALISAVNQAVSNAINQGLSLVASLYQDLGVTIQSLSLTLVPTLSAALSGLAAVLSVSISLAAGLNQSIGGISGAQFFATLTGVMNLSSTVNQALDSLVVSASISLVSALTQGVAAALSAAENLSSSVNQALASIAASASMSLVSTMTQAVGGTISAVIATFGSITANLGPTGGGLLNALRSTLGIMWLLAILILVMIVFALSRRRRRRRSSLSPAA